MIWPFTKRSSAFVALDRATQDLVQARAARMAAQERFLNAIKGLEAGKVITINGVDHHGEETHQGEIEVEKRR